MSLLSVHQDIMTALESNLCAIASMLEECLSDIKSWIYLLKLNQEYKDFIVVTPKQHSCVTTKYQLNEHCYYQAPVARWLINFN